MSTKGTKVPAIKNIPPKTDRELKLALDTIKEALEIRLGQRGDPLDRAITLRELSDSGIVKIKNKGKDAYIYYEGKSNDDLLAKVKGAKGKLSSKGEFLV